MENPEDASPGAELKKDEDVERVRRAHLNDLENIPAFLIGALMYVMSEPNVTVALWLIRVAVIARILHTIVSSKLIFRIFLKFSYLFSGLCDLSRQTASKKDLFPYNAVNYDFHGHLGDGSILQILS